MKCKPVFKSEEGRKSIIEVYDSLLSKLPYTVETFYIPSSYGDTFIIASGEKSKPPLLLLHGTSSNSAMWFGDIFEYSKNFRVFAVDIPGEPGKSGDKQYPLDKTLYSKWLLEVFRGLEIEKASIVGISLGGWMAANFSVNYPEMVNKLVLLCPSGIGPQRISFIFKSLPLMFLGEKGFDKLSKLINGNDPIPEEALKYSRMISRNFNLRTVVPLFSDEELKKLDMPLLLFAGEKDVLLDSRKTVKRILSLLPDSKVTLIEGAGHLLIHLRDKIVPFLIKQ